MYPQPRIKRGTLIRILDTPHTREAYSEYIGEVGLFLNFTIEEGGKRPARSSCRVMKNPQIYLYEEDYKVIGDPVTYNLGDKVYPCTFFSQLHNVEFEVTDIGDTNGYYEIKSPTAKYFADRADILPAALVNKRGNKFKKNMLNM